MKPKMRLKLARPSSLGSSIRKGTCFKIRRRGIDSLVAETQILLTAQSRKFNLVARAFAASIGKNMVCFGMLVGDELILAIG